MADGSIKIDTSIDDAGLKKGMLSATPLSTASGASASPRIEPIANMGAMPKPQVNITVEATGSLRGLAEMLGLEIKRVDYLMGV